MKIHPQIANSKFAGTVLAAINESSADDPAIPLARMILDERFHAPGEYDTKPIRMMRSFLNENPHHRLAKAADWSNDLVWMDRPEHLAVVEPAPAKTEEPVRMERPKVKRTKFIWDDDGRISEKIEEHE